MRPAPPFSPSFFRSLRSLDAGKWACNEEMLRQVALPALLAPEVAGIIVPAQGRQLQDAMASLRFAAFMPVLARLTEILGEVSVVALGPLLVQVARLHDCRYLTCREDLVRVISVLVRVAGLSETPASCPLNLIKTAASEEAPRAWLLPVLRDSVYNTSLVAWLEAVHPVALQVAQRAEGLRSAEKAHEARVWDTSTPSCFRFFPPFLPVSRLISQLPSRKCLNCSHVS